MTETELLSLLTSLRLESQEAEWIEFKHNKYYVLSIDDVALMNL